MNWKLTQIGTDPIIAFAVDELQYYLRKMNRASRVTRILTDGYHDVNEHSLYIGRDPAFVPLLPSVEDPYRDDAIYINVSGGAGIITGTNDRAVLIAVYRYLRELGCAFLRPGKDGDVIPRCVPESQPVYLRETPSYRHRAVCIEGAVSYEHVADMIDWLPKVGMNGYYIQFAKPHQFFRRWYSHAGNPNMEEEPITDLELDGMHDQLRADIAKRGLLHHAVGHSWTCEPFGVPGNGWNITTTEPPESIAACLAKVNGKRDWWGGIPLNTNLCYSNPAVRSTITTAITQYCEEHKEVDYLHFWLADASNNHCECDRCKELPADYYIMMLNELDEKLTAKGIDTKVVFLIYVDLLWAPKRETIKNPDRFTLMFAPITRTYSSSFTVSDEEVNAVEVPAYEKNKLTMPRSVAENVAHLRKWQEAFKGDSFDFDYHMMWDHYNDPGSIAVSRGMNEDMKNLAKLGLNGMNSCQVQRAFFPTSLCMLTMAETLWNKDTKFADMVRSYFSKAFGADGSKVWRYLNTLSERFDPVYQRGESPVVDMAKARIFSDIPAYINSFLPVIHRNIANVENSATVKKSWEFLLYHAQACVLFAEACEFRAAGQQEDAATKYELLMNYFHQIEPEIHAVFDPVIFNSTMAPRFRR